MIITNTCQSSLPSNEIVHGKRAVTTDAALRLARYFGTSEAFWKGPANACLFAVETFHKQNITPGDLQCQNALKSRQK